MYAEERAAARIAAVLYNWRRDNPDDPMVIDLRDPDDPDDDGPRNELDPKWEEPERDPASRLSAA